MYPQKAITVLTKVRDLLEEYPYLYGWNWNCCDNIGLLIVVSSNVNPPDLQHQLWLANCSYVQTNWQIIFDDYVNNKIMSYELQRYLRILFSTFTYDQLVEINNSYDVSNEYESYMSFLNAVIMQYEDKLIAA
jgi:hypothetical protein